MHTCYNDNPTVEKHWFPQAGELFIDVDTIKQAMLHLPNKLAAGIDGIPAILLKNYPSSLLVPVHILWQKSYEERYIPVRLKSSLILPQLKPGTNKSDPTSFRSIGFISQLTKVFENVIKDFVSNYLESYNLLGQL